MKKVLFVINTMGRAGAETAMLELMKKLLAIGGYELSLLVIIPRGEMFARLPKAVRVLNRRVSVGSVLSARGRLSIAGKTLRALCYRATGIRLLPYMVRTAAALRRAGRLQYDKVLWRVLSEGTPARRERYDLAISFLEGAAAYYVTDRVQARRKAAFIHIDYQAAGYLPEMDRDCFDKMDRVFVVSAEVGSKFAAVYPQYRDKVRLFRNILDPKAIRLKAETGEGFTDGFAGVRMLTIGRLVYQKAYDIAVEAMARIVKDGYDVRWYVIGEGDLKRTLEKQIQAAGLTDRFILLGGKDNPYPYLRQADIYVHATRFEGKSIAIEEAQILGKPILASDCTGNREQIVPDIDGILIPLDKDTLAERLEWLLDHPEIRRELAQNVQKKNLEHPEELAQLMALAEEGTV